MKKIKLESQKQLEGRLNKEVATFFDTEPMKCQVVMHDSWDDLAQSWSENGENRQKSQAAKFMVGFSVRCDTVHILSPSIMPAGRYANGKIRFGMTLKHEFCHLYVRKINGQLPRWLNEGICYLVAGQKTIGIGGLDRITTALLHKFDYNGEDGNIYEVGKYMVDQIMEKYGKETLLEIIVLKDKDAVYAKLKQMFSWLV